MQHSLDCRSFVSTLCLASLVTFGFAGCGDEEDPPLSHAADIEPLWEANCQGSDGQCHSDGSEWPYPNLGDGRAYDAIIGAVALQTFPDAPMNYVEPDDVANSYLVHKIEGTHLDVDGSGEQMPCDMIDASECLGNTMTMLEADIQTIKDWIEDGAPE